MSAITRVLISVSDKTGIVDFARTLADKGVEILSTGWYRPPTYRKRDPGDRGLRVHRLPGR